MCNEKDHSRPLGGERRVQGSLVRRIQEVSSFYCKFVRQNKWRQKLESPALVAIKAHGSHLRQSAAMAEEACFADRARHLLFLEHRLACL